MYKKIIIISLILVLTYVAFRFDFVSNFDNLKEFLLSFNELGWIIFILLFALAALFSVHGSILAIVGAIVYGPVLGGILSVIGATLGAALAFITARYLLRDSMEKKFANNLVYQKINEGIEKNGTDFLIITRLVIIFPYNIQNFIYGLTNIGFIKYTIITFFTIIPGTFLYTFLADELVNNGFSFSSETLIKVFVASVLLAALAILPRKYFERKGKI